MKTTGAQCRHSFVAVRNNMGERASRLTIRAAKNIVEGVPPLKIKNNATDFTGLPSEAYWGKVQAANERLKKTWFDYPRIKTEKRIARYGIEFELRKQFQQSLGMDEHGVTKGMRDFLARTIL